MQLKSLKNSIESQYFSNSKDGVPFHVCQITSKLKTRDVGTLTQKLQRKVVDSIEESEKLNIKTKRSIGTQVIHLTDKSNYGTQTEIIPSIIYVSKGINVKPLTNDKGVMHNTLNKSIGTSTRSKKFRNIGTFTEFTIDNPVSLQTLNYTGISRIVNFNIGIQCNIHNETDSKSYSCNKSTGTQTTCFDIKKKNSSAQVSPIVSNYYSDTNDLIVCHESSTQMETILYKNIATNTCINKQSVSCNTEAFKFQHSISTNTDPNSYFEDCNCCFKGSKAEIQMQNKIANEDCNENYLKPETRSSHSEDIYKKNGESIDIKYNNLRYVLK